MARYGKADAHIQRKQHLCEVKVKIKNQINSTQKSSKKKPKSSSVKFYQVLSSHVKSGQIKLKKNMASVGDTTIRHAEGCSHHQHTLKVTYVCLFSCGIYLYLQRFFFAIQRPFAPQKKRSALADAPHLPLRCPAAAASSRRFRQR